MLLLMLQACKSLEINHDLWNEINLDDTRISIDVWRACAKDYQLLSIEILLNQICDFINGHINIIINFFEHFLISNLGFEITSKSGRIPVFGFRPCDSKIEFYFHNAFQKELSINTSHLNIYTSQRTINLLSSSQIEINNF